MEDVVCSVSESAAEGMVLTLIIIVPHIGSINFYVVAITLGDVDVDLGVGVATVGFAVAMMQRGEISVHVQ